MEGMNLEERFSVKFNETHNRLGIVDPISHIIGGDIPVEDFSFRNLITKKYKTWLVKHHPDKVEAANPTDEFIIKEYGVALLQNDDDNIEKWRFMEKSTIVFSQFNRIPEMQCEELQNMSNEISLLLSILDENINMISDTVLELLIEIDSLVDLAVLRRNAIENGVCCVHSTGHLQILRLDCVECNRMQIVVISDDEDSNEYQVKQKLLGNVIESYDEATEDGEKEMNVSHNIPKRSHKKKVNPSRRKSDMNLWKEIDVEYVNELPYDIDGYIVYKLPFSKSERMKSSKDGRLWKTWVTSNSKSFVGIRRKSTCLGTWICNNNSCPFIDMYDGKNMVQFQKNGDCRVCGFKGSELKCPAMKLWEFDDEKGEVTVYHEGTHTCIARKGRQELSENIQEKLRGNQKSTCKVAEDTIIEELKKTDISWEDAKNVADETVDNQKMKNAKKKANAGEYVDGHSFEAVAKFKAKISEKDPFFLFSMNDRTMNGEMSYVVKCSKVQLRLACAMNDGFLRDEYCFCDGTYKRCPQYVTLGVFVFVPALRRMVKICTMETEVEGTENWAKLWTMLNNMIRIHINDSSAVFNPKGWVCDEGGGLWGGIKQVFGDGAVKRTVSCEFHFKLSVDKFSGYLSKASGPEFKMLSMLLMNALTVNEYEEAYNKVVNFIEEKPSKRSFLKKFLDFWHPRRSHFTKAFKPSDAPPVNLSEQFHSSYVRTDTIGLNLIDAAYRDTAYAVKLESSIDLFAAGVNCQGDGPNMKQRRYRSFLSQKRKASAYAEDILNGSEPSIFSSSGEPSVFKNSKHRPANPTSSDIESSDEETEPKKHAENVRGDRVRSATTKRFLEILEAAKVKMPVSVINDSGETKKSFLVSNYTVHIQEKPSCTCNTFSGGLMGKRAKSTCKHIVYVLINLFHIPVTNNILAQVAFTKNETEYILSNFEHLMDPNEEIEIQPEIKLSKEEVAAIFDGDERNKKKHVWYVDKAKVKKNCKCCICRSTMPEGKCYLYVNGLYIPRKQTFCTMRNFYFCALPVCFTKKPFMSNIENPPEKVFIARNSSLTKDDESMLRGRNIPLQ